MKEDVATGILGHLIWTLMIKNIQLKSVMIYALKMPNVEDFLLELEQSIAYLLRRDAEMTTILFGIIMRWPIADTQVCVLFLNSDDNIIYNIWK